MSPVRAIDITKCWHCILPAIESRRSSKLDRIERNRLLKENRSNPDLEKLARTQKCK